MKYMTAIATAFVLLGAAACQTVTVPATATYDLAGGVAGGGSAALPYFSKYDVELEALNAEMERKGLPVTVAETYAYAYNSRFADVLPEGDTGDLAADMKTATEYFQRILKAEKIDNADSYYLTLIETAQDEGFSLFAVVYRPSRNIAVRMKLSPGIKKTLTPQHEEFYAPYRQTVDGKALDTVYDWAAIPNSCFNTQAQQAAMFTLSANQVIAHQPQPDYWEAESKWLAGNHMAVVENQDDAMCRRLGIKKGITDKQ